MTQPVCKRWIPTHPSAITASSHMYVDVLFEKDKTAVVISLISVNSHGSIVYQLIVYRRPYPLITVICALYGVLIECLDDHYHTLRCRGNWFGVRQSASDVVSPCGTGPPTDDQKPVSMYRPSFKRSWCVTQSALSYDSSDPVMIIMHFMVSNAACRFKKM